MIGVITAERRGVARSVAAVQALDSAPSVLKAEIEQPFVERVIAPLGERLVGLGRALARADTARKIQYRLNIAGNPPSWDVNRILGLKVLGLGVFGVGGFLYLLTMGLPFYRVVLATALAAAFGYVLPNVLLYNAGQKREKLMRNGLPDAMDLLTISVEAGLGFDAAVSRVAKRGEGPLSQEFSRLLQEMQLGVGRTDAMRSMAERTSLPDLKSFCSAMVQADSLGIPIARVLRVQQDADQASSACGGEGATGAGADHDPARALHPSLPVSDHSWPCGHPDCRYFLGHVTLSVDHTYGDAGGPRPTVQSWRTTTAVRVFALAFATGMAVSSSTLVTSAPLLVVLTVVAMVTSLLEWMMRNRPSHWHAVAEAVAVVTLVMATQSQGDLGAYLGRSDHRLQHPARARHDTQRHAGVGPRCGSDGGR